MRSLALFTLLVALASTQETNFEHVPGRSADIILRPKHFRDKSFVYLLSRHESSISSIQDQSVADLVSHSVGGPVVNTEAVKQSFPKGSLFDKSVGNMMLVVDSLDSAYLADFDMKLFNLKNGDQNGKQVPLVRTSYPQDTVATLATLVSGTSPSSHGIIGSFWSDRRATTEAYKAGAYPYVRSVADMFSESFEGKSLILSASSDFQMASALGVSQLVHLPFNNEMTLSYNDKLATFTSVYQDSISVTDFETAWADLIRGISTLPTPDAQDSVKVGKVAFEVDLASKNLNATFDFRGSARFFLELQFLRNVMTALRTDPKLASLAKDRVPDLVSFAFAGLKNIQNVYGRDSAQAKICVYLLDETLVEVINQFTAIYGQKATVEVVFLGLSAVDALQMDSEVRRDTLSIVRKQVNEPLFEKTFPQIYLKDSNKLNQMCEVLTAALSVDVYCARIEVFHINDDYFFRAENGTNTTTNNTGKYTMNQVASFQITLWFSIILILTLLATICGFCCMDIGADTMLYRSTNLRHAHIS